MKAQLSALSAHIGANPNTLKLVSMVVFVSLTVVGLIVPTGAAFAGPISGPVDVF
jgi:hypothetical protein